MFEDSYERDGGDDPIKDALLEAFAPPGQGHSRLDRLLREIAAQDEQGRSDCRDAGRDTG
ncbi:MAG: hypothetical protein ACU0BF_12775 [Paracoccaceae bacterium]